MKQSSSLRLLLTTFLVIVFCSFSTFAQLSPGDIAIVGFNSDTEPDELALVTLASIPTGTVIKITDRAWTGANTFDVSNIVAEGLLTWTTTSAIPAGTLLKLTIGAGGVIGGTLNTYGTLSPSGWTGFAVASGGDNWFIYTGTEAAPNFIYGFANWSTDVSGIGNWLTADPISATTSYKPASLISGITAVALTGTGLPGTGLHGDNIVYTGTLVGPKEAILAAIGNPASWQSDEGIPKDLNPEGTEFPGPNPVFTLPPTVLNVSSPAANGPYKIGAVIPITVTFSGNVTVTGTPELSLTAGSGAKASYASGSGSVLTFNYTVAAGHVSADLNYTATTSLTLNGGAIMDASNVYVASLTLPGPNAVGSLGVNKNIIIDGVVPTLAITSNPTSLKAGQTALITFTFSEDPGSSFVWDGAIGDVTVVDGALGAISGAGLIRTATFTPTANVNGGTASFTVAANAYTDAAGNIGGAASTTLSFDTQGPTVNIVIVDNDLHIGETSLVTFTFSEAVTGFTNADLTIANGTLSNVTSADGGITWTATFTPTAGVADNSNMITLNNTGVADQAGNAGTGTTNSGNYTIDTVRPTATIVVADAALKIGETSLVTITFSEAVTGFTNADLTIANGTLSNVTSADGGITWTATFTPTAGVADNSNVIILDNTGVADAADNVGSGITNSSNYAVDTTVPTATIVVADGALAAGESSLVTITFNEVVSGFTNADLSVANGILSVVSSSDGGITWTATFTPTAGITEASNLIVLNNTGVTDLAGNAGISTTNSNNYSIDTKAPLIPAGLAATTGDTQIVLNWAANVETDLAKYRILSGTSAAPTTTLIDIPVGTTTYTNTGLTNGTTYYYRIQAIDQAGNTSAASADVPAVPKADQVIIFNAIATKTYGDLDFPLGNVNSSAGLVVTYTATDPSVVAITGNIATILKAGNTVITASRAGNTNVSAATDVQQTLTVNQAPLTITANPQIKAYGAALPTLTASYAGFVNGDTEASLTTLPTINTTATAASSVAGSPYVITPTGAVNPNYAISYAPGILSVTAASLAITANPQTKAYGAALPTLTASYAGFVNGDTEASLTTFPTLNTTATAASSVAGSPYVITATGAVNPNYAISYAPGILSVTAASLTITANPQTKAYGAVLPALTASYAGFLNGDTEASLTALPTLNTIATAASSVVGSPYAITATGAVNPNYAISYTPGILIINKAALTVTAVNKEKFVNAVNPPLTLSYSGFVNGESASVLTTAPTLSTTALTTSPIGEYPIKASGAAAANYSFSYVDGVLKVSAGAPTNVILAGITLYENRPVGTSAGVLSSTSDDSGATFTYSLVAGAGDADNALFAIAGTSVNLAAMLNYENKASYNIRIRSTTQHGFSLDKVFTISLTDVNEIPTLAAISNQTVCYTRSLQNVALTGISAGPETSQTPTLSVSSNNAALFDRLSVSGTGATGTLIYQVKAGAVGAATVTVTVNDGGGTANGGVDTYSQTFVITVNALPVLSINSDKGTQISKGETVFLSATGGATYVWATDNSIITGGTSATLQARPRETTTYTVTGTNASGCSQIQSITITVLDDMEKIKATNILTPNNDGFNDKWIIDNIDFYPNNEVKVFDKAGRVMFAKKGYDNGWDGTYNGVALAEGTYYYVIDFGTGKRVFKGFITIVREN